MTPGDSVKENATSETEARAKLRESFLRAITKLNGQQCNILTFEKSVLHANFCGWNLEGDEVLVRDLMTPAGVSMPAALLRTPDIIAIQFDKLNLNNFKNYTN